jgi:hypothetical protein
MLNSPSENADPSSSTVMPGPMTVFEQRRREAALSEDVPSHPVARRRPASVIGQKQRTTYAKTGHTVPDKRRVKSPLKRIE